MQKKTKIVWRMKMTKLMNKKQEIKNRIDLINKGEVPAGYKNSWGYVYPEEWDLSTLNSLCSKVQKKNKDNAQLQVLTNSATKGVILQEEYFDREIVNNENTDGYYIVEAGDFMYNPRISAAAPAGPINRNNLGISGIASPLYSIFRAKQTTNTNFIERYFESSFWHGYMKRVSNQGARHDRLNLLDEDFYKMPIPQPKVEEQEKIAEILSCCDKVIELKEKLLDEKQKEFISAINKYIYDKNNNANLKKIGDICDILDNRRIPLNDGERLYKKGEIPYYGANGILDYIDQYLFDEDLVLLAEDGGYFDEYYKRPIAQYITGKSWINNHAHILRAKNGENRYLYYALIHKNILSILNGGGRAKLNQADLKKIKIPYPEKNIQETIARILSKYEYKIGLLQQELEHYKQLKKSLSQLLLTGIVRTME